MRASFLFRDCPIKYEPPPYFRVVCVYHTDADTLWVEADLGFTTPSVPLELRIVGPLFQGFDAEERFTPHGKLATEIVKKWLPLGRWAKMTSREDREKYGRWLAALEPADPVPIDLLVRYPVLEGVRDIAVAVVSVGCGVWRTY